MHPSNPLMQSQWNFVSIELIQIAGSVCTFCVYNFREKQSLLFHNTANLDESMATHSVELGKPGVLCSTGPSGLLYVDSCKIPQEIHWLDCSTIPPKPAADRETIQLQPDVQVNDMCYVDSDGKQYVICAPNTGGVFAYNTALKRIEWETKKITSTSSSENSCSLNVRGITTYGRGFIFVSDYDCACVLMLTVEGVYVGRVLDLKDVGRPGALCWCEGSSSLIVAYEKNSKWAIVTVKIGKVF